MKQLFIFSTIFLFSCNDAKQKEAPEKILTTTEATTAKEEKPIEPKKTQEEPLVADTGQVWFKVTVTRNDSAYINYEGTWPVLLTTKNFATLAFTAAKGALEISHGLTFYIYGWPPAVGRIPVIHNASKVGEISMILVPEENGVYGLSISPDSGFVEITKSDNDGKLLSGYFEAYATNEGKESFHFKGQFLNVKPH